MGEILGEFTNTLQTGSTESLFAGLSIFFLVMFLLLFFLFFLALYIYNSIALQTLAKRFNLQNTWFAWIPFLNIYLTLQLANMDTMLMIVFVLPIILQVFTFIPYISILAVILIALSSLATHVIIVIAYMKICERRGYDKALGLLSIVYIAQLVLLGILAWGKDNTKKAS